MLYDNDDIAHTLQSLQMASERHLAIAEQYGMHPDVVRLVMAIYAGALEDVALAFGIAPVVTWPTVHVENPERVRLGG